MSLCDVASSEAWSSTRACSAQGVSTPPCRYLSLKAAAYVEHLTTQHELSRHVDDVTIDHLLARAQAVRVAFDDPSSEAVITAVTEFSQDCITLPDWVTPRYSHADEQVEDEQNDWTFGLAVAEAILAGVVAIAGLTEPGLLHDGASVEVEQAFEVLERLADSLDRIAPYLFGGLCRAEAGLWPSGAGLQRTLHLICTWSLAAVGRTMTYAQLTSLALWEWAGHDPLFVLILAKGALALERLDEPVPNSLLAELDVPPELNVLQAVVLEAVLGLPEPSVAFAQEQEAGRTMDDSLSIETRAVQLCKHRARLAAEAATSHILGPLCRVVLEGACLASPRYAAFLCALFQADVREAPPWVGAPQAAEAIILARESTALLEVEVRQYGDFVWRVVAQSPQFQLATSSFLVNLCDLAYYCPAPSEQCYQLVQSCLQTEDASQLAALCVLVANSACEPGFGDAGVVTFLSASPESLRQLVCKLCIRWRGPVRTSEMSAILELLHTAEMSQFFVQLAPHEEFSSAPVPPPPPAPVAPQSSESIAGVSVEQNVGLRALLEGAPTELCCAVDGRLLTDPVRSPHGITYERSVLASALQRNGGVCPYTGAALALNDCRRDPEMRQRATAWLRQQHSAKPGKSKRCGPAA